MQDEIRRRLGERGGHPYRVTDIEEYPAGTEARKEREPVLTAGRRDHLVPRGDELGEEPGSDDAGSTSKQDSHAHRTEQPTRT
ncbi:hypothetical protein GCM10010464_20210 [Pseudonocardia yunnanensis]